MPGEVGIKIEQIRKSGLISHDRERKLKLEDTRENNNAM